MSTMDLEDALPPLVHKKSWVSVSQNVDICPGMAIAHLIYSTLPVEMHICEQWPEVFGYCEML